MVGLTRKQISQSVMMIDTALIVISTSATGFILDQRSDSTFQWMVVAALTLIIPYLIIGWKARIFNKVNRYSSISDIFDIYLTIFISTLISAIITGFIFRIIPIRYFILQVLFSSFSISFSRKAWRTYTEFKRKSDSRVPETENRILIVGAGEGGWIFTKNIRNTRQDIDVFGAVDDDPRKLDSYIYGVPVLGTIRDISHLIKENKVDEVVITAPTMDAETYEYILDIGNSLNVDVKKMPNIEDVMLGNIAVANYTDIEIADLLDREEVELDTSGIDQEVEGQTILVTGAGGSIGSELVRQLAFFNPCQIILLGHGENSIYLIEKEMKQKEYSRTEFVPIICDIQNRKDLDEVIATYRPVYVFHAAAHKHVPLMEANPNEAVKNNIYGTLNVAQASADYQVKKFIMVSTDKANNPTNVMGATKRIAEMIVTGMNEKCNTTFSVVRFGNVLGSRGSVVPLFQEQIEAGGPVTVTDFRMTRYFMTIPEAARLVIQAGVYAAGGELFILDMGEPVKILDLAKKLIKLSGYQENEIDIVEIGIRPGEKLYEELFLEDETTGEKLFDKIYLGRVNNLSLEKIKSFVESLDMSRDNNKKLAPELLEFVQH